MSLEHRLVCADCLGPEGLATLPDKSVDHVITDPPYEPEAHTRQRRVKRGHFLRLEPIPFGPIEARIRLAVALQMVRVCRGWLLVFSQDEGVGPWKTVLVEAGAKWRRLLVWVKPDAQPQLSGDRPAQGHESIAAAWCGEGRSTWNGGGRSAVYQVLKSDVCGVVHAHPTQKPLALMEALVRDFTRRGDLVCDPFAGSGSTGVACKRLGRAFVGWEMREGYAAAARYRIERARQQIEIAEPSAVAEQIEMPIASGEDGS